MYQRGKGTTKNFQEAERWYRAAALANSVQADFYLGCLYLDLQDWDRAVASLRKSADSRFPPALYRLGAMYLLGHGVERDRFRAFEYLEEAAKEGHIFARRNIAREMIKGRRGIAQIPKGVVAMLRITWGAIKIASKDPHSPLTLR